MRLFCHDIVAAAVLFLFIGGLYVIDQRAYASQNGRSIKSIMKPVRNCLIMDSRAIVRIKRYMKALELIKQHIG